jgi:arylsulfatase A-like enzyme
VPLIFHAPGVIEPARTPVGASHVDIVPTVLDLLGVDAAFEATDGRRLFGYAEGGLAPTLEERAQIAELILPERQILRAIVTGRWKYITSHQSVPPGERSAHDVEAALAGSAGGSGPVIREELYDLDRDPGEGRNLLLAGDDSEVVRVRARLARQLRDLRASSAAATPTSLPSKLLDAPPEDRAHLEALGYLDADESE